MNMNDHFYQSLINPVTITRLVYLDRLANLSRSLVTRARIDHSRGETFVSVYRFRIGKIPLQSINIVPLWLHCHLSFTFRCVVRSSRSLWQDRAKLWQMSVEWISVTAKIPRSAAPSGSQIRSWACDSEVEVNLMRNSDSRRTKNRSDRPAQD